jgi:acetoacetyl-CoA synthetase
VILSTIPSLGLHLDLKPDDRLFWFSTTGWVVWNIVVCSLMFVESVVLYDGSPVWPELDRLWRIRSETSATIFGISGAYLGQCAKEGLKPADAGLADGLRGLIYTGSAIAPECFDWVYEAVDEDVWFSSVTGGTDVGCSFFFAGCITEPVRRGEFQCLGLGMPVDCVDEQGGSVREVPGELVITAAIPSMPVRLWNDADGQRYRDAYFDGFEGVWTHGDLAEIRSSGGAVVYGRSDATINRNGVRIGAAEIYRVVERMPEIADSLVVDLSVVAGADLLLFVVMAPGSRLDSSVESSIRSNLRESLSPRHAPDRIIAVVEIPKTKNGKKLEVPVRRILNGVAVDRAVNRASVANPQAIDDIAALARRSA